MSTLEAIFLGILQGLTEFLPVSSSGHLTLGQALIGLQDLHNFIIFDLICHLGTLLAIFVIYRNDILQLFTSDKRRFGQLVLATLPLFPLVLLLKPIKALFDQTQYLGFFFIITAFLLYLGIRYGSVKAKTHPWRDALAIGMFQAVAIVPGISRSGATISGARILGWQTQEAVTFSFLLAIPAILGGTAVELLQLLLKSQTASAASIGIMPYAAGFATSLASGCWLCNF